MSRVNPAVVEATALELAQMVKQIGGSVDPLAFQAKDLILSGRTEEAIQMVLPQLVAGTASPVMQKVAAALYYFASGKEGRGPKSKPRPSKWQEIGARYVSRREEGLKWNKSILLLAEEFNMSVSSVETSLRFYLQVYKKLEEILGI